MKNDDDCLPLVARTSIGMRRSRSGQRFLLAPERSERADSGHSGPTSAVRQQSVQLAMDEGRELLGRPPVCHLRSLTMPTELSVLERGSLAVGDRQTGCSKTAPTARLPSCPVPACAPAVASAIPILVARISASCSSATQSFGPALRIIDGAKQAKISSEDIPVWARG